MNDKAELEARRSLKKRKIIDSCRKAFSEGGIEATSISKLCKAAKVNPKVMYDYFPSKEEIVLACTSRSFEMISDIVVRDIKNNDGDIIENIDKLIDDCYSVREGIRFLYQVVVSPNYREKIQKLVMPLHQIYDDCKETLSEKFGVSIEEIEPIFHLIVSSIDYYCLLEDKASIEYAKKELYPEIRRLVEKTTQAKAE